MKRRFVLALIVVFAFAGFARAELTVSLEVEPQVAQVGDTVSAVIRVEGAGLASPSPRLPTVPQLELISSSSGQSISIVNGQTSISHQTTLVYRAVRTGQVNVGPAQVKAKGKVFNSDVVSLNVSDQPVASAPEDAPAESAGQPAFIDVEVKPDTVYPGQQAVVTFYFYLREGVGLERAEIASGDPTFSGALFHRLGGGSSFNFTSTSVGGVRYKVSPVLRYAIYPIAPGAVNIGSLKMSVVTPERGRRGSDPFGFDNFFGRSMRRELASPAKTVTARPLPAAGRPSGFENNVGRFSIEAKLDKPTVATGEGVTLSVAVEGSGNTEALTAPEFALPEGLRGFREASRDESVPSFDTMKSRRVFEKVIVPEKPGDYVVGPIRFDVFNPESGRYETLSAGPVHLSVTGAALAAPDNGRPSTQDAVELAARDIRTVKPDTTRLRETAPSLAGRAWFWLAIVLTPVAFALRVNRVRRAERLAGDVALARRLKAGKEARRRLAESRKSLDGDAAVYGGALSAALFAFIADHLGVEAPSLTGAAARAVLAERGIAADLVDEFAQLSIACDAMRFGGHRPAMAEREQWLERAGRWIDAMNRALSKGGGR